MGKKKEEFYFVFGLVKIKLRANIQRGKGEKKGVINDQYTMSLIGLVPLYYRVQGRKQVQKFGGGGSKG